MTPWWRSSSLSFSVALTLVIVLVVGYLTRHIWWPGPVARSERIVRQFATDTYKLVAAYRRSLATGRKRASDKKADPAAQEAFIEERANEALRSLQDLTDKAEERLDTLEGLPLRTLHNRLARIRNRFAEATAMIRDEADRAKNAARAGVDASRERPSPGG